MIGASGLYYPTFFILNDVGKIKCSECAQKLKSLVHYKRHLKKRHGMNEWMLFFCPYCTDKFADPMNSYNHIQVAHEDIIEKQRQLFQIAKQNYYNAIYE